MLACFRQPTRSTIPGYLIGVNISNVSLKCEQVSYVRFLTLQLRSNAGLAKSHGRHVEYHHGKCISPHPPLLGFFHLQHLVGAHVLEGLHNAGRPVDLD